MPNIGLYTPAAIERVIYGRPAAEAVKAEVERMGAQRVFLMVSRTLDQTTDLIAQVRTALGDRFAGQYDGMPTHAPRKAVLDATAMAREAKADLLLTYGGGSLTDAGRGVSIALEHDITEPEGFEPFHTVTNADGTRYLPDYRAPRVRQMSVPTTLSGGEFNVAAGVTNEATEHKDNYRHAGLAVRSIILDPVATLPTPEWLWLSSGIRAVDHCVETICSPMTTDQADGMALHGLKMLAKALPACKSDPSDVKARLDCQIAMWLSMDHHMANIQMGASHGIGHMLGGTCGVNHGYTSCVMLPSVLRWNRGINDAKQAMVAAALGAPGKDAADVVERFIANLGMPGSLKEVGVSANRFTEIAEHAMHDRYIHHNPRKITRPEQIVEILEMAA